MICLHKIRHFCAKISSQITHSISYLQIAASSIWYDLAIMSPFPIITSCGFPVARCTDCWRIWRRIDFTRKNYYYSIEATEIETTETRLILHVHYYLSNISEPDPIVGRERTHNVPHDLQ